MSINFFKKKDKLDYSREIWCPVAKKRHNMELGKNICPMCGEVIPERVNKKTFLVQTQDDHRVRYFPEDE